MTAQTTTTATAATTQGRSWYYLVTLKWESDDGAKTVSYSGVARIRDGAPRHAVTGQLLDSAKEALSAPPDAVVLFFSLEPDEL